MWEEILVSWIMAAIAVERLTELIKDSDVLQPLRLVIFDYSSIGDKESPYLPNIVKPVATFFNEAIKCGYCLSGELSLIICWMLPYGYFGLSPATNIIIKWTVLWFLAGLIHSIYEIIRLGRVKAYHITLAESNEEGE